MSMYNGVRPVYYIRSPVLEFTYLFLVDSVQHILVKCLTHILQASLEIYSIHCAKNIFIFTIFMQNWLSFYKLIDSFHIKNVVKWYHFYYMCCWCIVLEFYVSPSNEVWVDQACVISNSWGHLVRFDSFYELGIFAWIETFQYYYQYIDETFVFLTVRSSLKFFRNDWMNQH